MHRVAVIGGARTPFVKAGGVFASYSRLDLAVAVVKHVYKSLRLDVIGLDELNFGSVLLNPRTPNLAREIIFASQLPSSVVGHFVSNNCISGLVAIAHTAEAISSGRIKVGLAGGVESMSNPTLTLKPKVESLFLALSRSKDLLSRLQIVSKFRPSFFSPETPSPKEPSTGLSMGEHCEITAKEFSISRAEQDEIAFRSHRNAVEARSSGVFNGEVIQVGDVAEDTLIRADTSIEKLGKLRPVFDRSSAGTITAGNSSALTDGASVVCLMSEDYAKEAKRKSQAEILGYITDLHFAALHPNQGLLMAPFLAVSQMLSRNSLTVDDIDIFEVHEAFGAQVAANLKAWSKGWNVFPNTSLVGDVPQHKLNIHGGSIALGHPFAATGGRLVLSALNALKKVNGKTALISVCAAGGAAGAMLISRE